MVGDEHAIIHFIQGKYDMEGEIRKRSRTIELHQADT
jgi:hypothetical protein